MRRDSAGWPAPISRCASDQQAADDCRTEIAGGSHEAAGDSAGRHEALRDAARSGWIAIDVTRPPTSTVISA